MSYERIEIMFSKNVGTLDQLLRISLGIALVATFFLSTGGPWHWLLLIGIVPLLTGLLATCPLYRLLGVSTRRT